MFGRIGVEWLWPGAMHTARCRFGGQRADGAQLARSAASFGSPAMFASSSASPVMK